MRIVRVMPAVLVAVLVLAVSPVPAQADDPEPCPVETSCPEPEDPPVEPAECDVRAAVLEQQYFDEHALRVVAERRATIAEGLLVDMIPRHDTLAALADSAVADRNVLAHKLVKKQARIGRLLAQLERLRSR